MANRLLGEHQTMPGVDDEFLAALVEQQYLNGEALSICQVRSLAIAAIQTLFLICPDTTAQEYPDPPTHGIVGLRKSQS